MDNSRHEQYLRMLESLGISEADFDEIYRKEFAKISFVDKASILTRVLNAGTMGYILSSDVRKYSGKKGALLMCAYVREGGDPAYFTQGAGAPGNCVIV